MSVLGQAAFFTAGAVVSFGGWNDHHWRASTILILLPTVEVLGRRGSGAPISIHLVKSATISAESCCFGGISRPSSCLSALMIKLLPTLLGTTAGACSPPLRIPSRVSSRNWPISSFDVAE